MSEVMKCPHCEVMMIPIEGRICPACNNDIYDEASIKISVDQREWEAHIYWGLRQNIKLEALVDELAEKGYDAQLVREYALSRMIRVNAARYAVKVRRLYPAVVMIFLGLASFASYLLAFIGEFKFGIYLSGVTIVGLYMLLNAILKLRTIR